MNITFSSNRTNYHSNKENVIINHKDFLENKTKHYKTIQYLQPESIVLESISSKLTASYFSRLLVATLRNPTDIPIEIICKRGLATSMVKPIIMKLIEEAKDDLVKVINIIDTVNDIEAYRTLFFQDIDEQYKVEQYKRECVGLHESECIVFDDGVCDFVYDAEIDAIIQEAPNAMRQTPLGIYMQSYVMQPEDYLSNHYKDIFDQRLLDVNDPGDLHESQIVELQKNIRYKNFLTKKYQSLQKSISLRGI